METVAAFNSELSGLYDSKPPISKAKMAMITRAAMKAIKFYKHVVQSVEKFILKCKPEYKIPGLYVIDSIVRQSRHQFGSEKDVFAPRFARNIKQTFANLFRCSPDDKSRIIRVLNLWQKNNVFAPEVIQPLFDLADPNNPIYLTMGSMNASQMDISATSNGLNISAEEHSNMMDDSHSKGLDLAAASGHQTANTLDQSTIRQLQQLQQILRRQTNETKSSGGGGGGGGGCAGVNQSDSVKFNKKLLDYDYGDEEEEDKTTSSHVPNLLDGNNLTQLLKDPNVLRQLQTLQKLKQQEEKQMKLNEMRLQEEAFEKHLQNVLKGNSGLPGMQSGDGEKEIEYVTNDGTKIEVINLDGNDSRSPTPDRDRYKRRRTSRSRSPRGRDRRRRSSRSRSRSSRSRSRGGSRSPRSNRRRTSRERGKDKEREKEKEKEKEYERERRKKGLPDIKKEHLSVCSTTLWVGHLSKLVQQEELSDTFGKYGDIVSIDMIHPRGCAFIVMNRRQDAHKAMGSLKNYKMQGRAITISWAAGKGVKSKEWKDYWDLDLGVSYIPWDRLNHDTDLVSLEEGGMFDEDTLPDWMKDKLNQKKDSKDSTLRGLYGLEALPPVDTSQPPPTAGGMLPGVPMVPSFPLGPVPRLMPPMGVPLPGNMVPGIVPGIPMPPSVVPGMPPPHMLPPPGGMFGPIPPPMDKSVPPPTAGSSEGTSMPFMGNMQIPPMQHAPPFPNLTMPPQFNQQQQQMNQMSMSNSASQNDDHMDIEMEDEVPMNIPKPPIPMNFNQPPPMFQPPSFNMPDLSGMGNDRKNEQDDRGGQDNRGRGDFSNRDRSSRWGSERSRSREREMPSRDRNDNIDDNRPDFTRRSIAHEQMNQPPPQIWRENGPGQNFQPPNFGDRRGPGVPGGPGGMGGPGGNMMGIDMAMPPNQIQRPSHFDGRRGDNFGIDDRRGGQQRDFFQNPGSRFGPQQMGPGMNRGQIPLRGGLQPPFGPRLGPMFMRGPSRPPGFNMGGDRPPFERDERGGGGNSGGRMRGVNNNSMDRRQGNNWREDDDAGRRGNRFYNKDRDRDRDNDRGDRNRDENNKGKAKYDPIEIEDWDSLDDICDPKHGRKVTPPPPTYERNKNKNEEDWDDLVIPPPPTKPANQKRNYDAEELMPKKKTNVNTEEDWDSELVVHKVPEKVGSDLPLKNNEIEAESYTENNKSDEFDIFGDDELPQRNNRVEESNNSKPENKSKIDPNDFSIPGPSPPSDTAANNDEQQAPLLDDETEDIVAES